MAFSYYCASCHRIALVPVHGAIAACQCKGGPWIDISARVQPAMLASVALREAPPLLTPEMKVNPPPVPKQTKPTGGPVDAAALARARAGLKSPGQLSHRDGLGRWVGTKSEDPGQDYRGLKFVPGLKTKHRQGKLQGHAMTVPKDFWDTLRSYDREMLTRDRAEPAANKIWTRVIAHHMVKTGKCIVTYRDPETGGPKTEDLSALFRRVAEGRTMAGVNWRGVTDKFHDGHETIFDYLPPPGPGRKHVIYYVEPLRNQGGRPGPLRVVLAPPDHVYFTVHYARRSWQVFSWDHGGWFPGMIRPYVAFNETEQAVAARAGLAATLGLGDLHVQT